jgi:maltose/moltooligosaccharide transporter
MSAKWIHVFSLLLGGLGLASVGILREPWMLLTAFVGVGIAWASILSMPYAMLSSAIPAERMGVYMGIFNFFIVIPQILVAIVISRVMENFPQFDRIGAVVFGGICMLVAAVLTLLIPSAPVAPRRLHRAAEAEGMLPTATSPESPIA